MAWVSIQMYYFAYGYSFPAPFIERTIIFPLNCLSPLLRISWPEMFISRLKVVFMLVLLSVPHCLDYCGCVVCFEIRKYTSSSFVLFFKIAMAILGLLHLYKNFRISWSISVKKLAGILIVIVLNVYISLGSIAIIITLNLPVYEYGVSFYLNLFKIFFNNVL